MNGSKGWMGALGLVGAWTVSGALAFSTGAEGNSASDSGSNVSVRDLARRMDKEIERSFAQADRLPNDIAEDSLWARRAYLTVIGRIPNQAELEAFLSSKDKDRDAKLIDSLLDSPGYVSHMFNQFADWLRIRSRLNQRVSGEPYAHWVRDSLAQNKPYDEFVNELLVSEGAAHQRGNGATGYYLRDRGMPEDNMANTMRVFLGTRIECAQCHDHPFDSWTQKQFFEMAALTQGMKYSKVSVDRNTRREQRQMRAKITEEYGAQVAQRVRNVALAQSSGIYGSGTGLIRLPKDYAYEDAKPLSIVAADVPFSPELNLDVSVPEPPRSMRRKRATRNRRVQRTFPETNSRDAFAQWLSSEENPRFALVIANRMWKHVMGVGLIEPVDDIRDSTQASHPELMDLLAETMVSLDFDLKAFLRVLLNSETFRRSVTPYEVNQKQQALGPVLRRLSAEQIWDSLVGLVLEDIDHDINQSPRAEEVYARYDEWGAMEAEGYMAAAERIANRGSSMRDTMRDSMRREAAEKRATVRRLLVALKRAERRGSQDQVEDLQAQLKEAGYDPFFREKRRVRDLMRASELPSPAPDGHFLRDFGQSDRDQIDASHRDPSIPQVLNLLNGFLERYLLGNDYALAIRGLDPDLSHRSIIQSLFMSVLSRPPNQEELRVWLPDFRADKDQAIDDLLWTLVNAHEFLFMR